MNFVLGNRVLDGCKAVRSLKLITFFQQFSQVGKDLFDVFSLRTFKIDFSTAENADIIRGTDFDQE